MIKLYNRDCNKLLYWETWENEGVYFIHWGEVGSKGNSKEVRNSFLSKASDIVSKEENARRVEGYSENEDLQTVIIQYKIDGFGNRNDSDKRYKVEELMNECLGWTGLGHCDGGDIGSGTINSFCLVVDSQIATGIIVQELSENNLLDGAIIIEEKEEELFLLWPTDYSGVVSY